MARSEKAVFTVLLMVENEKGQLLMQKRLDPDWPGICFPGGHVEPGESFTEAAVREMREETGLTVLDPRLCGVKQFQTKNNARYVVFFYKATQWTGTIQSSDEGDVFWISKKELSNYRLVDDFEDMIKVMEDDTLNEFYYYKRGNDWGLKLL
jgi:8-oxo-dGTP diphosphatase